MESERTSGEGASADGDAVLGGVFRGRRLHSMRPLDVSSEGGGRPPEPSRGDVMRESGDGVSAPKA